MRETLATPTRNLDLLEAVITDGGASSVAAIARRTGIPVASAHRHVAALVSSGFLSPAGYGRHLAGPKLRALASLIDTKQLIAAASAPLLDRLAAQTRCVVQLGTFENDMVTYRLKTGRGSNSLFTRVGMQLEAYCSGIGKVLLANLPFVAREAYLDTGPFIALTPRTITDPDALRAELMRVRSQGYAVDDEEVDAGLRCLAVPVHGPDGTVLAAISASRSTARAPLMPEPELLALLSAAARQIEANASLA
jgi:IclR family acetate operon transcriptional repressor